MTPPKVWMAKTGGARCAKCRDPILPGQLVAAYDTGRMYHWWCRAEEAVRTAKPRGQGRQGA